MISEVKKVGQVDVRGRRMDYGLLEDGRGSMIRVVMVVAVVVEEEMREEAEASGQWGQRLL
jgi:hypothetical protein